MGNKEDLAKVGAKLTDSIIFACLISLVNLLIFYFYLLTSSNFPKPLSLEFFFPLGVSLAAVCWAVNILTFLLPAPTIGFFIFNLVRYSAFHENETQNPTLVTWYCLSMVTAIVLRKVCHDSLNLSPGNRIFGIANPIRKETSESSANKIKRFVWSILGLYELQNILKLINNQRELFPAETDLVLGNNEKNLTRFQKMQFLSASSLLLLGLCLCSFWKLPLEIQATNLSKQILLNQPTNNSYSKEHQVLEACKYWLYAGKGSETIKLAEEQIQTNHSSAVPYSKEFLIQMMYYIDLADRTGYSDSVNWQKIADVLSPDLS